MYSRLIFAFPRFVLAALSNHACQANDARFIFSPREQDAFQPRSDVGAVYCTRCCMLRRAGDEFYSTELRDIAIDEGEDAREIEMLARI